MPTHKFLIDFKKGFGEETKIVCGRLLSSCQLGPLKTEQKQPREIFFVECQKDHCWMICPVL